MQCEVCLLLLLGQAFQQRFYKAGIGTYWEVSCLSNQGLQESLQIPEIQLDRVDYNGMRASAYQWASESDTIGALWDIERVDDFEELPGIGATFEKRLYMAGIFTYEQLVAAGRDRLAEIIDAPDFRQPDFNQIIEVARSRVQPETDEAADEATEIETGTESEVAAESEAEVVETVTETVVDADAAEADGAAEAPVEETGGEE